MRNEKSSYFIGKLNDGFYYDWRHLKWDGLAYWLDLTNGRMWVADGYNPVTPVDLSADQAEFFRDEDEDFADKPLRVFKVTNLGDGSVSIAMAPETEAVVVGGGEAIHFIGEELEPARAAVW